MQRVCGFSRKALQIARKVPDPWNIPTSRLQTWHHPNHKNPMCSVWPHSKQCQQWFSSLAPVMVTELLLDSNQSGILCQSLVLPQKQDWMRWNEQNSILLRRFMLLASSSYWVAQLSLKIKSSITICYVQKFSFPSKCITNTKCAQGFSFHAVNNCWLQVFSHTKMVAALFDIQWHIIFFKVILNKQHSSGTSAKCLPRNC